MAIRILLADDHDVVREGLRTILRSRADWEICGEVANGKQAVEAAERLRPDIMVLDITMPIMSGLEATEELQKLGLSTRILIFTMHDSKSLVRALKKAGAQGYVLKSYAARDLIPAIEKLLQGETFFGPDLRLPEPPRTSSTGGNLLFRQRLAWC
ncbi:MAG TPA: response regulator transcription factor [Terriglobales bacterium]|nr:response regulator transcription factor [Terriglobales bacterium]